MWITRGAAAMFSFLPVFAQGPSAFVYGAAAGEFIVSSGPTHGDALIHIGGGGEYVTRSGIGVGADGGVLSSFFQGSGGTLSVDGSYHFRHAHLVDPFVVAGYSLFFNQSAEFFTAAHQPNQNLFNFGGGTNLWFSRHLGAKIELRDHVYTNSGSTIHYAEFMLGLGFR
jgi:hypothetical protein